MHKTLKAIINGDPRINRTESQGEEGVQTYLMMKDGRLEAMQPKRNDLMSIILSPENLNKAYKQVVSNQGAGGIDKMDCKALLPYLREHKEELLESIMTGGYKPNPVVGVRYPRITAVKLL